MVSKAREKRRFVREPRAQSRRLREHISLQNTQSIIDAVLLIPRVCIKSLSKQAPVLCCVLCGLWINGRPGCRLLGLPFIDTKMNTTLLTGC